MARAKKKPPPRPKKAAKKTAKKRGKKKATKKKSPKRVAAGKKARAKGGRGEVRVVHALKILWPDEEFGGKVVERVKRNYQDRGAERDGPDIEAPKLSGEVKHRATSDIQNAIKDAKENCRTGDSWFAVDHPTTGVRKGRSVIVFDLDEFVKFVQRERVIANGKGYEQGYEQGYVEGCADVVNLDEERRRRAEAPSG